MLQGRMSHTQRSCHSWNGRCKHCSHARFLRMSKALAESFPLLFYCQGSRVGRSVDEISSAALALLLHILHLRTHIIQIRAFSWMRWRGAGAPSILADFAHVQHLPLVVISNAKAWLPPNSTLCRSVTTHSHSIAPLKFNNFATGPTLWSRQLSKIYNEIAQSFSEDISINLASFL